MTNTLDLYIKAARSANIGIWEMNIETGEIYWDPVTRSILEVPTDFIAKLGDADHFYPLGKTRDKVKLLIDRAINQGISFNEKLQITTYNNNTKYVESICQVEFSNGKPSRLLGTFHDITKEENLINERQLSFDKFSSIFSSANDAIFIMDISNGIITDCNLRCSELTGYENAELVGMHNSELFPVKNRKAVKIFLAKHLTKDKYNVSETSLKNKSGDIICVEVATGKKFKVENQTYAVCFFRDITTRKGKEIELLRLLEVMSQQNNKLFNFSHIVSHNIRSHASNLSMVIDVMENTEDIDEKLSYVEMFKEGTEKLSETIEYLNEIITIQKNTGIEKKKIRLKKEIEKTTSALSLAIKESQITIIHNIPDRLTVRVIPAYLDSILLNLFTNAIKYKSPKRKALLEIDYEIASPYLIITFKDNGIGIDLDKNGAKIFGMYKTFHGNDDAKGIGLFITKNQLEAMDGKIEVQSKLGRGSTFKIYLNEN